MNSEKNPVAILAGNRVFLAWSGFIFDNLVSYCQKSFSHSPIFALVSRRFRLLLSGGSPAAEKEWEGSPGSGRCKHGRRLTDRNPI